MTKKKLAIIFGSAFIIFTLIMIFNKKDQCEKKDYSICNIRINGSKISATVVYSSTAQMRGLMGVTELKDGEGMIFVYDSPQVLSFWMKNTLIPLSIAFVESDGNIVKIYDMDPELSKPDWDLRSYASPSPVKYAIEANAGWFDKNGITVSSKVKIPNKLK